MAVDKLFLVSSCNKLLLHTMYVVYVSFSVSKRSTGCSSILRASMYLILLHSKWNITWLLKQTHMHSFIKTINKFLGHFLCVLPITLCFLEKLSLKDVIIFLSERICWTQPSTTSMAAVNDMCKLPPSIWLLYRSVYHYDVPLDLAYFFPF